MERPYNETSFRRERNGASACTTFTAQAPALHLRTKSDDGFVGVRCTRPQRCPYNFGRLSLWWFSFFQLKSGPLTLPNFAHISQTSSVEGSIAITFDPSVSKKTVRRLADISGSSTRTL